MGFENITNHKRVENILDILSLLSKSGASNNVDREAMWTMLEPALNLMGEMLGEEPQKPEPVEQGDATQVAQQAAESTKAPDWVCLREMLQKAPLKDLSVAMAVIMSRFDDELVSK